MVGFPPNYVLDVTWVYRQSTGQLSHIDGATGKTTECGSGYSGNGPGLNNPADAGCPKRRTDSARDVHD